MQGVLVIASLLAWLDLEALLIMVGILGGAMQGSWHF